MSGLMLFNRQSNESIDGVLSRFLALRHRASQGGGMTMSFEGYSWLLFRATGANQHQLLNILRPFQERFPSDEAEFNAMQLTIRRMGHILEHTYGNVANHLRTPPQRTFFMNAGANMQHHQILGKRDPILGKQAPQCP